MKRPSDETLMAYADGALSESQAQDIRVLLKDDMEARLLVESFRQTAHLASQAYNQPMEELPPQGLVDMIRAGTTSDKKKSEQERIGEESGISKQAGERNIISFFRRAAPAKFALPMAASISLIVGLSAGIVFQNFIQMQQNGRILALGQVESDTQISALLEEFPTGQIISVENASDRSFTVIATFRDRTGRVCREIELLTGADSLVPSAAAIACRDINEGWAIEGAIQLAQPKANDFGYTPSGAAEQDALSGLLQILGASKVLTPDEEAALIEKNWKL